MTSLHNIAWHSIRLPHGISVFGFWHVAQYPIGFVAGWTAIAWRRWRKRTLEERAQSWPTVQGRILSGMVQAIPKTTRHMATLTYTYFVDEYRSGRYIHEFTQEGEADEFVRQMKDKHILIRYKENKPDVSLLEQSMVEQTVALSPVRS